MNRQIVNISVWLSVLACAYCCGGEEGKVEAAKTVVCKLSMLANQSKLAAEAIGAELQVLPKQPLSRGAIEFSIALSNHSENVIVFQAGAFLDGMLIWLKHKSDSSLSLPQNVRSRINAPVLPPRPYVISGWHTVTDLPDGTTTTNELPSAILQSNDPKELQNAKVEIPATSILVVDFKIVTLVRTTQIEQKAEAEKAGIAEGDYTLALSMFLFFPKHDSSNNYMRFGIEKPVTISIHEDVEAKHKR